MGFTKFQAYVAMAQDLKSDDAEWSVCTGARALEEAKRLADKWCERPGHWISQVRKIDNDTVYWCDIKRG